MDEFNIKQTCLNDETIEKYDLSEEVLSDIKDTINSIEFVRRLISPDRPYSKDLEKDEKGRIVVDITNPHILEDMNYFREAAITFTETGRYTDLIPSRNPQSPYKKFWLEEKRRCLEGYVRESDGEWVTGYHYHYLNYSPILLTKKDDKSKKRADRVEDFPRFWDGDYLFFHYVEQAEEAGQHANLLKARGKGFSFKMGSMDSRNMVWIANSKSFTFASEKEYLDPDKDGIMGKTWYMLDFIGRNTPLPRARLKDTPFEKTLGYEDPTSGARKGLLSTASATTLKDNPDRARGKRGKIIKFEESGVFPYLLIAWKIAQKSVEQNNDVFGLLLAGGTGGTEGADFEAAEQLFYKGEAHNVLMLPNVFDKDLDYTKHHCSLFFPEYLNREGAYDTSGNSDVIKGLIEIYKAREKIRKTNSDPEVLTREKAESPITPQEAVLRVGGSIFPISMLKDYRETITPMFDEFIAPHFVGKFKMSPEGKPDWETDTSLYPVREYPIRDNLNKEGAVEIFEQPYFDKNNRVPAGRYIAGIDSFDDDHSTTNSLGCIFIFDLWTDRIVAEYTARPLMASTFYDTCIKLQIYYNAIANYENANKGIFGYYSNHNKLHLLADTPIILKDMELVKGDGIGNKAKGTPGNNRYINAWARRLQADWMRSPAIVTHDFSTQSEEDLEEEEKIIYNLQKIRSIGYIDEAIHWNIDGNFDRVSSMGMVMIYRENQLKYIEKGVEDDVDHMWDSDYWNKAFNVSSGHKAVDKIKNMR